MPHDITDADAFTDPIVIPADADAADLTYILTLAQGLANRTRFNKTAFDAAITPTGIVLPAPVQSTRYLAASSSVPRTPADWTLSPDGSSASSIVNSAARVFDLTPLLPRNAEIVRVRALVDPGLARTGTTRMKLTLQQISYGLSFAAPVATVTEVGVEYDDESDALQWITLDLASSPVAVADGVVWQALVRHGADVTTDVVHGLAVEFTASTIRNN